MTEVTKTRAERLNLLLEKYAPKAVEYHNAHKMWPREDTAEPPDAARKAHAAKLVEKDRVDKSEAERLAASADAAKRAAPYVIKTLDDGRVRLIITSDDGDGIAGIGANVEEALASIEAKGAK